MFSSLFDQEMVCAALASPTGWRGNLDGRVTFYEKELFSRDGYKVSLHRFVAADDPGCFHTHPATAIRCVLSGGYCEEFLDGTQKCRSPGYIGIVHPDDCHRIHSLMATESISLWIRTPKTHSIELLGDGWGKEKET